MDLEEIKSRINPQYQDVRGTESYERKWLCDEIERLTRALHSKAEALMMQTNEIERLRSLLQNGSPVVEGTIQHMAMEIAALKKELEIERMRLAACGTAALGYFNGCADEYRSASLDDVLRLREEIASCTADIDREVSEGNRYMLEAAGLREQLAACQEELRLCQQDAISLQKNAERYRFIRSKGELVLYNSTASQVEMENLDAAIDAAMKESK